MFSENHLSTMGVWGMSDLENINQLLVRCDECGTPFVEEEHLKNHVHQSH